MKMPNLETVEIKAFVPAKDFELCKSFYQDVGFTLAWDGGVKQAHPGVHRSVE